MRVCIRTHADVDVHVYVYVYVRVYVRVCLPARFLTYLKIHPSQLCLTLCVTLLRAPLQPLHAHARIGLLHTPARCQDSERTPKELLQNSQRIPNALSLEVSLSNVQEGDTVAQSGSSNQQLVALLRIEFHTCTHTFNQLKFT